jgi:hypothetical protein
MMLAHCKQLQILDRVVHWVAINMMHFVTESDRAVMSLPDSAMIRVTHERSVSQRSAQSSLSSIVSSLSAGARGMLPRQYLREVYIA